MLGEVCLAGMEKRKAAGAISIFVVFWGCLLDGVLGWCSMLTVLPLFVFYLLCAGNRGGWDGF